VAFIAWWTEVVAQRTENRGCVEGDHQWDTRWGTTSPWCALWASSSGEKRGWGSLTKEACERRAYQKTNEREGVRYGNESKKKSRADKRAGERGAYSARARRVRRHAAAKRARLTWV
jgi:hypothetical protein